MRTVSQLVLALAVDTPAHYTGTPEHPLETSLQVNAAHANATSGTCRRLALHAALRTCPAEDFAEAARARNVLTTPPEDAVRAHAAQRDVLDEAQMQAAGPWAWLPAVVTEAVDSMRTTLHVEQHSLLSCVVHSDSAAVPAGHVDALHAWALATADAAELAAALPQRPELRKFPPEYVRSPEWQQAAITTKSLLAESSLYQHLRLS